MSSDPRVDDLGYDRNESPETKPTPGSRFAPTCGDEALEQSFPDELMSLVEALALIGKRIENATELSEHSID
jgi:hypothetical protein